MKLQNFKVKKIKTPIVNYLFHLKNKVFYTFINLNN